MNDKSLLTEDRGSLKGCRNHRGRTMMQVALSERDLSAMGLGDPVAPCEPELVQQHFWDT